MPAPNRSVTGASAQVIQPMICILKGNLKYLEHWVRVARILKKHPNEEVAVWEHLVDDTSLKVKEGDRLAILAHGTKNYVGYGGVNGGDWFYDENMLGPEIRKLRKKGRLPDIKRIELLSCESGVGDKNSLAARLAKELEYKYNVWGYRGSGFSTAAGKNRASLDVHPEQDIEVDIETLKATHEKFGSFMREFEQTVAELESGKRLLSGELVRQMVEKFNSSGDEYSPDEDPPHKILETGRVIVEKETGHVFIKRHKEYGGGKTRVE
jgi:hypothetical protein